MNDNQLEKLHGLLKDFSTAMLIAIAKVNENTDLRPFTSRDSDK